MLNRFAVEGFALTPAVAKGPVLPGGSIHAGSGEGDGCTRRYSQAAAWLVHLSPGCLHVTVFSIMTFQFGI